MKSQTKKGSKKSVAGGARKGSRKGSRKSLNGKKRSRKLSKKGSKKGSRKSVSGGARKRSKKSKKVSKKVSRKRSKRSMKGGALINEYYILLRANDIPYTKLGSPQMQRLPSPASPQLSPRSKQLSPRSGMIKIGGSNSLQILGQLINDCDGRDKLIKSGKNRIIVNDLYEQLKDKKAYIVIRGDMIIPFEKWYSVIKPVNEKITQVQKLISELEKSNSDIDKLTKAKNLLPLLNQKLYSDASKIKSSVDFSSNISSITIKKLIKELNEEGKIDTLVNYIVQDSDAIITRVIDVFPVCRFGQ